MDLTRITCMGSRVPGDSGAPMPLLGYIKICCDYVTEHPLEICEGYRLVP